MRVGYNMLTTMAQQTHIFRDIDSLYTLKGVADKNGRKPTEDDLSRIDKAAFVVEKGMITWVGETKKLPKIKKAKEISLKGRTVIPGLTECHTHLVFAGTRAHEFEQRQQGKTYQEITAAGGGIGSTVTYVRKATKAALQKLSQPRVDEFLKQGVTTLEIKSGYGLNIKDEFKMLEVAKSLKGPDIVATFLGPHSLPPEKQGADSYLEEIIKALPQLTKKKLSDRVDIFIEKDFFTLDHARKYFEEARKLGLKITAHVEQLSRQGGAQLATEFQALSVDHNVQMNDQDIQSVAKTETVAVCLPTADFYMKIAFPPARKLIDAGACVALATDFNPGTSPTQDLSFVGMLARLEMQMTLPEVLASYTYNSAKALGLENIKGSIQNSRKADFVVLDGDLNDLFYKIGHFPAAEVWISGQKTFTT